MMQSGSGKLADHRTRLYERYVTLQLGSDLAVLQRQLDAPQPYLMQLIAAYFPADKTARILDAGCGHGLLLHVLKKAGYTNTNGVETSPEQVEMAHALGIDNVQRGDLAEVLAQREAVYDVVVAFDVLEHFTKDEVLDLLVSMYRALRPGGRLILHVPNGEAIFAGKIFFGDFTHQVAFTARSVAQVLRYAGFEQISCFEDQPTVHGLVSGLRRVLWAFIRTSFRIINLIETGDTGKNLILSQNLIGIATKTK
jgi:2-polyprenyl-3-methyl-5-hydroxy-6-metoxy-1,4-benzoquinol methylase